MVKPREVSTIQVTHSENGAGGRDTDGRQGCSGGRGIGISPLASPGGLRLRRRRQRPDLQRDGSSRRGQSRPDLQRPVRAWWRGTVGLRGSRGAVEG